MKNFPKKPCVALLVETSLSSGQDILIGIGQYIREHGPWSVYHEPHDLNRPPPKWFRHWTGEGIIARLQDQRIVNAVMDKGVPVVDVLGVKRNTAMPLVHVDNRAIADMAAEHLIDRGFVNFAYFGEDEYWSRERCEGFASATGKLGYQCSSLLIKRSALDRTPWDHLVRRLASWLATLNRPVGIMLSSDVRSLLAGEACRDAGLVIGQHVALLGVGNDRTLCEMSAPPLSSVEANHLQVGYEAAAMLDRLMKGDKVPAEPLLVKPWYVAIRESTDFLGVNDTAIARALHFTRINCGDRIGINDVARYARVSRSVLQRRFRSQLHRSVHDEIIDARVHRAMELLRLTDLSVEEIAERAGFSYAQNMSRVFRKRLGRSPKACRRRGGTM